MSLNMTFPETGTAPNVRYKSVIEGS
jgi:hypothetical protein